MTPVVNTGPMYPCVHPPVVLSWLSRMPWIVPSLNLLQVSHDSFGSFGVYAYDLTGKLLWSRNLGRLHTRLGWGEAVTPVVHGDSLVLNRDQEADSKLVVLDAATGKTRWEVTRDEKSSWSTPFVWRNKVRTEIIAVGGKSGP